MEYLDVLDEKGRRTGKSKPKPDVHRDGDWHRSVHIWFINSKGEILLQKRGKAMEAFPGYWDISAAGHVSAGQTPEEAAWREVKEEIGINLSENELNFLGEIIQREVLNNNTYISNEFANVYLVKKDLRID